MPWSEDRINQEADKICYWQSRMGAEYRMAYKADIAGLLRRMQNELLSEVEDRENPKLDELIKGNQEIIDILKGLGYSADTEPKSNRLVDILGDSDDSFSGFDGYGASKNIFKDF